MFRVELIAGTQGDYQSIVFQVSTTSRESLQPLSSICFGYEPFKPVEHLAICSRWNILANNEEAQRQKDKEAQIQKEEELKQTEA